MRVKGTLGILAACTLATAGCGFLKKDRISDASGPGSGADVGTAPEAAGADAAAETPQLEGTPQSQKDMKGTATFSVKRDGDVPEGYGIVPGTMTLGFSQASIVSGSVGGLSVAFESTDEKGLKQALAMLLPSGDKMSVWYSYEGGKTLNFKHSPLPFKLTDGDYPADPKDARGHDLILGPVVTRHYKTPDGSLSAWLVHFRKFKLEITEASIVDEKLTMSGTFSGESVPESYQPPAAYSISGSFKIADAELGLTMRD
jgi:hypothetical protein